MIHAFVVIPSAIAEISMVLYLLVIGVKTVNPESASLPRRDKGWNTRCLHLIGAEPIVNRRKEHTIGSRQGACPIAHDAASHAPIESVDGPLGHERHKEIS
jgi:hypothetical protein